MPTPDLYSILGLPRDAGLAAIKAAFRQKAKDLHPDHGGDPEQFRLLKLAYDVLSDPDQRRHYDQTGETPSDKAEQQAEEQRFRAMVGDFLVNLVAHGAAPQFTDILRLAEESVQQALLNLDGQVSAFNALAGRLGEVRSRLHPNQGPNLLADIVGERLEAVEQKITELGAQRARWLRLQETLKDYVYEVYVESVP